jgi:hypothetical protein
VSLAVVSILCAYTLGKYHRQTGTPPPSPPRNDTVALKEGQTILGVAEMKKEICFYIGDDMPNTTDEE